MCRKEIYFIGQFPKITSNQTSKITRQSPEIFKIENRPGKKFFCLRRDICRRQCSFRQKFAWDKKSKNGKFAWDKTKLTADFSLGNTGGWGGGLSNTMIMIGNFRVIKGLMYVMICYVSL